MTRYELTVTEESDTYRDTWTLEATEENLEATKAGLRSGVKLGSTLVIQVREV